MRSLVTVALGLSLLLCATPAHAALSPCAADLQAERMQCRADWLGATADCLSAYAFGQAAGLEWVGEEKTLCTAEAKTDLLDCLATVRSIGCAYPDQP